MRHCLRTPMPDADTSFVIRLFLLLPSSSLRHFPHPSSSLRHVPLHFALAPPRPSTPLHALLSLCSSVSHAAAAAGFISSQAGNCRTATGPPREPAWKTQPSKPRLSSYMGSLQISVHVCVCVLCVSMCVYVCAVCCVSCVCAVCVL